MTITAEENRSAAGIIRGADSAGRVAILLAGIFLLLAVGLQVLATLKLAYPDFLSNNSFLSYGRLQPMADATALFGWLTFSNLAIIYYLLPRLTGARLWNEPVAVVATFTTAAVTVLAVVGIGLGYTDGRPLADVHYIADAVLLITYLVPLVVTAQTIRHRTETSTYVSLYYVLAGLVWLIGATIVGNIPGEAVVGGLVQSEFYTSTIYTMWAVGIGIGGAYYIVPKTTGNPLYSRSMAMVGFWSLVITSLWAGLASQIYGPVGDWAESIGAVFALGMIIPAVAVLANLVGTMSGKWDMLRTHADVRFAIVGSLAAVFVALVAGTQGFRSVSAVIGLTTFVSGTQLASVWGVGTLFACAFGYHAIPRTAGRLTFSPPLARTQLRLLLTGVVLASGALWAAGLASGYTWVSAAYSGTSAIAGDGFSATADAVGGLYSLGLLGMLVMAAAALLYAYNVWRTFTSGQTTTRELLVFADEEVAS